MKTLTSMLLIALYSLLLVGCSNNSNQIENNEIVTEEKNDLKSKDISKNNYTNSIAEEKVYNKENLKKFIQGSDPERVETPIKFTMELLDHVGDSIEKERLTAYLIDNIGSYKSKVNSYMEEMEAYIENTSDNTVKKTAYLLLEAFTCFNNSAELIEDVIEDYTGDLNNHIDSMSYAIDYISTGMDKIGEALDEIEL